MFSKRRSLSGSRKYSLEFFKGLISDLSKAGFTKIEVKLPYNIVGPQEYTISAEKLIERERNYPSLILVATNSKKKETLKVLFVNRVAKVTFVDDTFPSGESGPPALYFQSPDPARVFSVFEFFYEYFKKPSLFLYWIIFFGSLISLIIIISEVITLVHLGKPFLYQYYGIHLVWDVVILIISCILMFKFFKEPKGLWIKPKRELRIVQLINMAIRGDLRDNPIVTLIVTIIGTILATVLLKILKVIP